MPKALSPKLFALLPLLVTAASAISAFGSSPDDHPTTVDFPGVSLGTLSIISTGPNDPPIWNCLNDTKAAQAVGRVQVPAGKFCILHVNYQTAADTTWLAKCKPNQLIGISFSKMPITDEGLANLQPLTGLRALDLPDTDIGDAGLKHIAKLSNLEYLNLDSTNISGAGVPALSPLKKMENLVLARNPIGGDCLKFLKAWPQLTFLSLKETRLKDADLSTLAAIPNLEHVDLSNNPGISAAGIPRLAACKKLTSLRVGWTSVKPGDSAAFKQLHHLKKLLIGGDAYVPADEQKWRTALPGVQVHEEISHNSKIPIELFNPHQGNYRLPGH